MFTQMKISGIFFCHFTGDKCPTTFLLLVLGAANQLYENDLTADKGHKGEVFAVTRKGYEYADNLGNLEKSRLS